MYLNMLISIETLSTKRVKHLEAFYKYSSIIFTLSTPEINITPCLYIVQLSLSFLDRQVWEMVKNKAFLCSIQLSMKLNCS